MITNALAIAFSNNFLRPYANQMAQLYDAASSLVNYWNANGGSGLVNPTVAPTVAQAAGGSFTAATYSWKYTWVNALGETLASGNVTLLVTATDKVTVTIPALPGGATQANIYRGTVVGSEGLVGNTVTTTFVDTGATVPGVQSPTSNTTGLIPNDSEVINDSAVTGPEGRPIVTGLKAVNIVSRAQDIVNLCQGSVAVSVSDGSKAVLNTLLDYATNP